MNKAIIFSTVFSSAWVADKHFGNYPTRVSGGRLFIAVKPAQEKDFRTQFGGVQKESPSYRKLFQ